MFGEQINEKDGCATTSRLKAWWLSKFRGYRVKMVKTSFRPGPFGGFRKSNKWVLVSQEHNVKK